MRRLGIVLLLALAGCGSSAIEGTLTWKQAPVVTEQSVRGSIQNSTSHSLTVDAKSMRLLDDRGKKVAARIRVGRSKLTAGEATNLRATWKAGKPVRIDYGAGTLDLGSD